MWILEYPVQAVSDLSLTSYCPEKAESALRSSDTLPSKGLSWPENELLLTVLYFRHLFTYCFDKKGLNSQDILYKHGAKSQHRSP